MPRPSSPVYAKASTNCPYLTLENPHHHRQSCLHDRRRSKRWVVFSSTARPEGANRDAQLDNLYLCSIIRTHEELACRSRHRFLEPIHNVKEVETNVSPPWANPRWKLFVFISGDEGADSRFGPFVKAKQRRIKRTLVEPIGIEPMTSSLQS